MQRIPVSGPWITQLEIDYVAEAAATAWYSTANVFHQRFESTFAAYLGVKYTMALPSCTSAIHLALAAAGVGAGDEVIVPDLTWIASAAPITYVGAEPVFADVDAATWCLTPEAFAAAITPRTKAVIPVGLYGSMPKLDQIRKIAEERGIIVIEDAAEALGSEYNGQKAGSLGDCGVFSFHGSKTLTTGEGGLLATNRLDLYQRAAVLRDHGRPPGDRFFSNTEVAFKYKMSSLQAALGLAQLERVEELITRKRLIFDWYRSHLGEVPEIVLNAQPAGTKNSYWMVTVILDPKLRLEKLELMELLSKEGIDSRPFFHPLSSLQAYQGSASTAGARARNPVSYRISPYGVNLPSALNLTPEQVKFVCDTLKNIIARSRTEA